MIRALGEASGPTITIISVLASVAFIAGQPTFAYMLLITGGLLLIMALVCIEILKRRGDW